MNRERMYDLILGPVITEKSTLGAEHNQVTFRVRKEATKPEIREAVDYEVPISVKVGASRIADDIKLITRAGVDAIVFDGMEGGTAASPAIQLDHTGIPTIAGIAEAAESLRDMGLKEDIKLIVGGGIRHGADAAKCIALGADAVYIGTAALIALGCHRPIHVEDYHRLGTTPYECNHCHTGLCPVGITTQDAVLEQRLEPAVGARRVKNYFKTMVMELTTVARACGKSNVHNLEPEDLVALTVEAAAMARIPLAGTNWIPGWNEGA